ncbi:MAG: hypothetical protein AAFO94_09145 [Bacteroidota bacterium]
MTAIFSAFGHCGKLFSGLRVSAPLNRPKKSKAGFFHYPKYLLFSAHERAGFVGMVINLLSPNLLTAEIPSHSGASASKKINYGIVFLSKKVGR